MRSSWPSSKTSKTKRPLQDFNRRQYANPLFPIGGNKIKRSAARRPPSPYNRLILLVLGILIVIAGIATAIWGPFLRATTITINGATSTTEKQLRNIIDTLLAERRFLIIPQSNILAFDTSEAQERIGTKFSLSDITVIKRLPHQIDFTITEKQPVAAILTDTNLYAIDQTGAVIRELTKDELNRTPHLPEGAETVQADRIGVEAFEIPSSTDKKTVAKPTKNLLPVIIDVGTAKPGKTAVSAETLALVRTIDEKASTATGTIPFWYAIDEDSQSVTVTMDGGWQVYWSALLPYQAQADRLAVTLREKVGDQLSRLIYIDLRYDEKIFLRFQPEPTKTDTK